MTNRPTTSLNSLVIVCGGTGGHFYPGLSIARKFKEQGGESMLFLSGKKAVNQAKIAASYQIESQFVPASPIPHNLIQVFPFVFNFLRGILRGRRFLRKFQADALLGMGSYTSVPAAFAAISLRVPLFLHDGNARIGRANRFLSRYARYLASAFPPVNGHQCHCPSVCTGMPVRNELLNGKVPKTEAIAKLNEKYQSKLRDDLPTLLIFGGSQGAQVFNKTLPEALFEQDVYNFQAIHLTGKENLEEVTATYSSAPFTTLILETTDVMNWCYSASDLVVCRSGGSSLAELAIYSKFAILVPYPFATDDHQTDNAEYYGSSNAAFVVQNDKFSEEIATELIYEWRNNLRTYEDKGIFASLLAKPNAAISVIEIIRENLTK